MTTELRLSTDLIEFTQPNALETFTDRTKVDAIIAMVADKANAALENLRGVGLYTADTEEGRAAIKSLAFKVTKSKTALESIGKDLAKEAKELPKKIDAGRGRFDEELDRLAKQIKRPVTAWEERDEKRKADHLAKIDNLKRYAGIPFGADVETINGLLAAVDAVKIGPECEEFLDGYQIAKQIATETLQKALLDRVKYEADQAELVRLREEADRRLAIEQAAAEETRRKKHEQDIAGRAALEAIEEANRKQAEVQAAHTAELERTQREAQTREAAIQHAAEAEQRRLSDEIAARKAKDQRVEAEKTAEEVAQKKRESDKEHRKKFNRIAVADLMRECSGLTEDLAIEVIKAIAQRKIAAVSIAY